MTKDEILRYIFLCVKYKHDNDISPCITKSAYEKEDLLFEGAIEFLENCDKENSELKKELEFEKSVNGEFTAIEKLRELKKENSKLKEKLEHRNCVDCSNHHSNIKLFKAKEIIKKFYDFVNNDIEYDSENPEVHTKMWNTLCAEVENFIKEE